MGRLNGIVVGPDGPRLCFDAIRERSERVVGRARFVKIDDDALSRLASVLRSPLPEAGPDPAHLRFATPDVTLAYVITLDAINFGSGWFPHMKKRGSFSGYYTVATRLRDHFDENGPFSVDDLRRMDVERCCGMLGQDRAVPEMAELMGLFASALTDLGELLAKRYDGAFRSLVEEARGSASRLAGLLSEMPFYLDVSRHGDLDVPFLKRAQLTAADLHTAFEGAGPGRFDDVDDLTVFADNLVPHVLRMEGVLVYDPELLARIEQEDLLEAGSPEEVEIRAAAVHAVERLVAEVREGGGHATARALDYQLWRRGHDRRMKARPRHRARTVYY